MNAPSQTDRTNRILLAVFDQKLSSGIGIVGLNSRYDIFDGQLVSQQCLGSNIDLILLFETSKR